MNNESITRVEAEKRLFNEGFEGDILAASPSRMLDCLFPPFEPKEGEVITVKQSGDDPWSWRKFRAMDGTHYSCTKDGHHSDHTGVMNWIYARPLTDKEKGL